MTDTKTFFVSYDDSELVRSFSRKEKQFVFGIVNAINKTAKRLQKAEFARVREEFHIRKPRFFFGTDARPGGVAARISPFAHVPNKRFTNGLLYAEVAVYPQDAAVQRRTLLPLFEAGGTRSPFVEGARASAAPITGRAARPTDDSSVPKEFTFTGLGFRGYRRGKLLKKKRRNHGQAPVTLFGEFGALMRSQLTLGGVQWKGKQRTFILQHSRLFPDGGVFQRFGPKPEDVRAIYKFLRPFPLKPRLRWLATAEALAPAWLHEAIEAESIDIITHNASKS